MGARVPRIVPRIDFAATPRRRYIDAVTAPEPSRGSQMSGEILEAAASEVEGIVVSEVIVGDHEPSPERGRGGVAVLLTVAAVVAAVIGFRAAIISSSASESWQSALRTEVKRSASATEDVRYLYQTELPLAFQIIQARIVQGEMLAAAQGQTGAAKQGLLIEAGIQAQIISGISSSSDLATKPEYALTSGGLDLGQRLADLRAEQPAMVALDPDGLEAAGDKLANKAEVLSLALIPTSVAAFLGVLSQPFRRRRVLLLRLGTVALAGGAAMALIVEVLA